MKTCAKCNSSCEDDKKFCKNCGNQLDENSSTITGSKLGKTVPFLILIIAWDALHNLIWLIIQKLLLPKYAEQANYGEIIQKVYRNVGLITHGIPLIIFGVSIYFVREKKIRLFLAICMIIYLVNYYINNLQLLFK